MNEKELQEKETLAKDLIPHVQMSEAGDWIDHGIEEVIRLAPTLIAEVRRLNELYRECADDATQFKQALEEIVEYHPFCRQGQIAQKALKGDQ
jgi:hypothetical protein